MTPGQGMTEPQSVGPSIPSGGDWWSTNAPPTSPGGSGSTNSYAGQDPAQMFLSAMQESGLDPVAMQGHGQQIADAVNKKYPGLGVTVDPKTDAIMWPGIGAIDVTIDSGKGGWAFQPSASENNGGGGLSGIGQPSTAALQADPSYQWRLQQGLDAVQRSAASRGTLLTGGTLKALNDYAGQSASQEFGNIDQRQYNWASLGKPT
jgi:hypothetical protein